MNRKNFTVTPSIQQIENLPDVRCAVFDQERSEQLLVLQTIYFSAFHFNEIRDEINATAGELRWKSLFDVYDHDQLLDANLKLALKLSYRALHPGDNRCLLYGNTFQRMMTQHFCSSLIFGGRL